MAGKPDTWRLDYFANASDFVPSRSEIIEAMDADAAADQAAENMRADEMRVDVTRTIIKKHSPA